MTKIQGSLRTLFTSLFVLSTCIFADEFLSGAKPENIFQSAIYDYTHGSYRQSIEKLNFLLDNHKNFDNRDDIFYWIGLNYKKLNNYPEALKYLYAHFIKFPNSNKIKLSQNEIKSIKTKFQIGHEIFTDPKYNELLEKSFEIYNKSDFNNSDYFIKNTEDNKSSYLDSVSNDKLLISNVFYETDIRQALQDISMQSEIPIIVDNSVHGYVTMELNKVPFENALSKVLIVGGYDFKKIDNFYIVGAVDPNNSSFPLLAKTELININYIKASEAASQLSRYYQPYIKSNDESNTISVTASSMIIDRLKESLNKIDVPPKQVKIEAVITEVTHEDLVSAGIDWSVLATEGNREYSGNVNYSDGIIDNLGPLFFLSRAETGTLNNGKISFDLVTIIKALIQDGKAEIKANPSIVTANAKPANISIAKEQYFSVVTGPVNYPYTRLEKVSAGIFLTIKPIISNENAITVDIETTVSSAIGQGREGLPLVASRKATTNVRVLDGEYITIGGLTQLNTQKVQNKIPLLGSIPLIGYLFSYTKYNKKRTDIVILIRPEILP